MRMRLFAVFLFLFLMTLFFGTLSYVWLLWNTYWSRIEKLAVDHHYLNRRGNQVCVGNQLRKNNIHYYPLVYSPALDVLF